jgi:hypothetical protein
MVANFGTLARVAKLNVADPRDRLSVVDILRGTRRR